MWERIYGYAPPGAILICAILSFVIPVAVYYLNQKLHEYGDPPWKKKDKEGEGS
ncbi:hypothetical protein [Ammoniphilus resinae]|uniref:Uncharacterized protein n=1 Tax=Ammoniphilus resinae TaxID=861532 RepID=A0ABS4GUR5_9BACL|nr:hypothetical protein [Ammoniphilus resinae]MBP1933787.1 hypothetical protein [Ammoniphilus resinae]